MPYKFETEKRKIPRELDRRVKISLEDRKIIIKAYKTGNASQRKLAKAWNVSRRLIQFIIDPSKKVRDLELRRLRGGSKIYYDKDKHKESMKQTRKYKQELAKKGELI